MKEVWMTVKRWGEDRLYIVGPNVTQYDYFTLRGDSHAIWITLFNGPKPLSKAYEGFQKKRKRKGIRKLTATTRGVVLHHVNLDFFHEDATEFRVPTYGTSRMRDVPVYCIRA